ncbi:MAG: hypothetical protein FJ255_10880 [Phycisphaerae bacterium]|nr:hypothetical protein [Phycisphaerae bacterium]
MKCDRCENEATVTDITRRQGVVIERHLCEKCASEAGVVAGGSPEPSALVPQKPAVPTCPECGLAITEFRQGGLLGCPACYKAFEATLAPMIERAHEGATHHIGKTPRCKLARSGPAREAVVGGVDEQVERLRLLKRQLDDAVRAEQYERAATIRDELRRLGGAADPATP